MQEIKFIYWMEYECPKCGAKLFKRKLDGEPHPEYPTQFPYWCEHCGYEEYRDVNNTND